MYRAGWSAAAFLGRGGRVAGGQRGGQVCELANDGEIERV